jgi:hypothetical protein
MLCGICLLTTSRLSGGECLKDGAPNVTYKDVLNGFDPVWCVKGIIATRSNLVTI